ncbi:MAG: nucleoside 2-deoxyribosyltransferase [Chloroflexi bacterium]|nr:nucleoside 2-deoxyribosyltransferase [Chloroflexota bacterium]
MPLHIYVAGPLFTPAQRAFLERIDSICRDLGFTTYLPHRDAGVFDREGDARPIFEGDLRALNAADAVVAVLDGCDVDSGTAWEMGYAYALGRPIIGYVSDVRIARPAQQINPMIYHSLRALVRDDAALRAALLELAMSRR